MSDLLKVTRLNKKQAPSPGAVGYLEFTVSEDTAPYLVTSTRGLVWAPSPSSEGLIKTAYREDCSPVAFFREVVASVLTAGKHYEWGNVHPLTERGMQAALDHVGTYDVGDLEILVPRGSEDIFSLCSGFDRAVRPSSWIEGGTAIVIPKDRQFVGGVWRVSKTAIAGLVHNAARGMAILTNEHGDTPDETEPPA